MQEPKGKMARVIAAVDRYVSDFGTLSAVASRYMRGREIAVIDPTLWRILWLRKWKKEALRRPATPRSSTSSAKPRSRAATRPATFAPTHSSTYAGRR